MEAIAITKEEPLVAVLFKQQWAYLPVLHIPDDAVRDGFPRPYFLEELNEDGGATGRVFGPVVLTYVPDRQPLFCIIPSRIKEKDLKNLCQQYEVPYSWVTGQYRKSVSSQRNRERGDTRRKIDVLTKKQFNFFKKKLSLICPQAMLIAEMLWHLNGGLCRKTYVTLEELLRIKCWDVSVGELGDIRVDLKRDGAYGSHRVAMEVSEDLGKRLSGSIVEGSPFLFSNKYGGPLSAKVIGDKFRKAGKEAGLDTVTSLALRPRSEQHVLASGDTPLSSNERHRYREVSLKEFFTIESIIPAIKPARGRKPQYASRSVFNAILFHIREQCPLRSLPEELPPWRAVHSQYRRWKSKGVWNQLEQWLLTRPN